MIEWARKSTPLAKGYEVSSAGDKRFSAFNARMPDGRSIEQWYQCDIKGYEVGGRNWRLGKGKAPRFAYPDDQLYELYLNLWRIWVIHNPGLAKFLQEKAEENGFLLTDCFANTPINQARALAQILNEWF